MGLVGGSVIMEPACMLGMLNSDFMRHNEQRAFALKWVKCVKLHYG